MSKNKKGLISDYGDSDSDEDTSKDKGKVQDKPAKPAVKSKEEKKSEPESSPKKPASPGKVKAALTLLGEKPQEPAVQSDSDSADEGNFIMRAKRVKAESEDAAGEKESQPLHKKALAAEDSGLDAVAKSLFSVLPAPRNLNRMPTRRTAEAKTGVAGAKLKAPESIRDANDEDFLLSYNNVQMPKAEVSYSSETTATAEKKPKEKHREDDEEPEGPVVEMNESELRDDTWKMNYMKMRPNTEKMDEMQAYLNEYTPGKEERGKNQITHLAYQAIKQQLAERYASVQQSNTDGRKKYGW